ncbi:MAG: DUF3710 domain-containing protein [Propionibacteriaceae bacterium]
MIFRRKKQGEDVTAEQAEALESTETTETAEGDAGASADESTADAPEESNGESAGESNGESAEADVDWDELDDREWRTEGPFDIEEVDLDVDPEPGSPRIDLGSLVLTGFEGLELRLQVSEETKNVVSAMMMKGDSALEVAAFAAPRSGGLWSEVRADMMKSTSDSGGSVAVVEGPFGTELRRLLPVKTPDGKKGYQPSRMWVAQGPRWMLRGIVYGQAAVADGLESPVAELLETFRHIVVRRGDDPKAPGDLLPLTMPENARPVPSPAG